MLSAGKNAEQPEVGHVAGGNAGWPTALSMHLPCALAVLLLGNYLMKLLFTQRLYLSVHSSCVHNS